MSVEVDLYTHLKNDTNIASIVNEKIFPLVIPQGIDPPSIVYTVVNNADQQSLDGDVSCNKILVQLDCYCKSYLQAKELLGFVKNALYDFKYYPLNLSSRDLFEKDTKLYRQLIEFNLNT